MNNPVIESLLKHRSVRKFQARALEPEVLDTILNAGIRAATAHNLQHYSILVVDDPAKKKALSDDPKVENATMIFALADEYRNKRWLDANGAPFFYNHPSNLFVAMWDAILVLQNIVTAAESLGLGTVFISKGQAMDIHGVLGAPDYIFPAGLVLVGYPDEDPPLRPRLPLQAVFHHNGYHIYTDAEIMEYHRQRDQAWETLTEEDRRCLEDRHIHNIAQRTAQVNLSLEAVLERSALVGENLKKSRFIIEPD
jgi:FMN reductase (NADPH)